MEVSLVAQMSLLLAVVMASYLFLFVMVSGVNDLKTNICCNSETCLPTNKITG